jgi:hypothetical protein
MRIKVAVPEEQVDEGVINAALEAVTRLDENMIAKGASPTADEAIAAGAVWRPEPPGDECFDHGATIAQRGWGDCDDWAPLGAATLRASGEDPGATAVVIPSGPMTYHAVVQRSDGTLEDPSVAAGMKPLSNVSGSVGDDGNMQVYACDPHDGRIYTGALLPTTGPLSLHCGVGMAIRGLILPDGPYYEARVDTPIAGSHLVRVRSYFRRAPRAHRGRGHRVRGGDVVLAGGAVPYAIACIGHGRTALDALDSAIMGAVLCGDASGLDTSLDRYKLLAMQAGIRGLSPGQTRDLLREQLVRDLQVAASTSGLHPHDHSQALIAELTSTGMLVQGIHGHPWIVGDFFSDVANAASGIVSSVSSAVNSVAKAAGSVPWGDIIHDVEGVVSVVPGLGTAVSDVVAAAETAYDAAADLVGGHPLDAAIDAAYNFALGSIPGAASLHPILDGVVGELKKIADGGEPAPSDALNVILAAVPSSPSFGSLNPQSIAASIAKLVTSHLGVQNTKGGSTPGSKPAAQSSHIPPPGSKPATLTSRITPPGSKPAPRGPAPKPPAPLGPVAAHAAWAGALKASQPKPPAPAPPGKRPAAPGKPIIAPPVMHPIARAVLAIKPPGIAHAGIHVAEAAQPGSPGAPPGASHWSCLPGDSGGWQCRWL